MISNEPKNSAIRAYEIMKEKGYTPEEIQTLIDYLDQTVTQPLETMFFFGFGILAILILIAPELTRRIAERFISR